MNAGLSEELGEIVDIQRELSRMACTCTSQQFEEIQDVRDTFPAMVAYIRNPSDTLKANVQQYLNALSQPGNSADASFAERKRDFFERLRAIFERIVEKMEEDPHLESAAGPSGPR